MDLPDLLCAPQLLAAAGRVDAIAADLRGWSGRLATASADRRWDGDGARAFRHRADETATRLHRAAVSLDSAVTALRRHAARVSDAQTAQTEAERRAWRDLLERLDRLGGHR